MPSDIETSWRKTGRAPGDMGHSTGVVRGFAVALGRGRKMLPRRRNCLLGIALGILIIGGTIALTVLPPVLSQFRLSRDMSWYDLGFYGLGPERIFQSFDTPVSDLRFLQTDARCSKQQIFLAPRGPAVLESGGTIFDANGALVYRQTGVPGDAQDFKVQEYRGEKFLTYWAGYERQGMKQGLWYMMDETYTIRYEIKPGGDYEFGDMHEFLITREGTALITIYRSVPGDMTAVGGPEDGWLLDCVFQEVDIETGDLVFEWSAADHVPLETTYLTLDRCTRNPGGAFNGCGDDPSWAFDFHHMNSIEKDDKGNYLVSSRATRTLHYIDGKTGEIIWNLGGKRNDFEDLSDGRALDFRWQHDARFHDEGRVISLFDNREHTFWDFSREQSAAVLLDIDVDNRTVALNHRYENPHKILSYSQGSTQILKDTDTVSVGFGRAGALTEFSRSTGEVLCDARFAASLFFPLGPVTSYRVHRNTWTGRPRTSPSAVSSRGSIYVSWNGATEVSAWRLEVADAGKDVELVRDEDFRMLSVVYRNGFETKIDVAREEKDGNMRVVALDQDDNVLGVSNVVRGPLSCAWALSPLEIAVTSAITAFGIIVALCVFVMMRWRVCRRSEAVRKGYEAVRGSWDGQDTESTLMEEERQESGVKESRFEDEGRESMETEELPPYR